ncbi:MAG: SRPBCC family protein [Acidimicrobiia bacterium]|jgi:uncharacterized protein YndB with AHSA1/START domain
MSLPPVRKERTVQVPPATAFAVFTDRIGEWWPLATHSIGGDEAVTALCEPKADGRIYERLRDGTEHEWGTVRVWEPPSRLVISWFVGRDPAQSTEIEVRFDPAGEGACRVSLEHRDWERLGDEAAAIRDGYDTGWDTVLGGYTDLAGS